MVGNASRANGALGGRPRGTVKGNMSPQAYEARKLARKSLQERAQQDELELLEILVRPATARAT